MIKISKISAFFISLFLLITTQIYSQESLEDHGVIGKIFTVEEANELFGKVDQSVNIELETVAKFTNKLEKYIMFDLKQGELVIADKTRKPLNNTSLAIPPEEPMHIFSVEKVIELLKKGQVEAKNDMVTFEKRGEKLTVTYGSHTLELAIICPPVCY